MASSIFHNSLIRNLQNVDISHDPNLFIFFLQKTYIASLSAIFFMNLEVVLGSWA